MDERIEKDDLIAALKAVSEQMEEAIRRRQWD